MGPIYLLLLQKRVAFFDRRKNISQNVLAACDFSGLFTYLCVGWEGSAHDARVYAAARLNDMYVPPNHYYLADAGFPEDDYLLTPYRGYTYHLKNWDQQGREFRCHEEYYNFKHAQARNIIERAFGIIKNRWRVLKNMPQFSYKKQCDIVEACFILENFIKIEKDDRDDRMPVVSDYDRYEAEFPYPEPPANAS